MVRTIRLDTSLRVAILSATAFLVGLPVVSGEAAAQTRARDLAQEILEESDRALADGIRRGVVDRVRYARPERVPHEVRRAAAAVGAHLATAPVLAEGRIELLHYLWEQSVCADYHRYGNLGARAGEPRAPVV